MFVPRVALRALAILRCDGEIDFSISTDCNENQARRPTLPSFCLEMYTLISFFYTIRGPFVELCWGLTFSMVLSFDSKHSLRILFLDHSRVFTSRDRRHCYICVSEDVVASLEWIQIIVFPSAVSHFNCFL